LDDFVDAMRRMGVEVRMLREETQGVRRGVVECLLP
jgi:protein-histidine N-methyltransferase